MAIAEFFNQPDQAAFSPEQTRSLDYLVQENLISSVNSYIENGGQSERVRGFANLSQTQQLTRQLFQLETHVPQVTVLTHQLWEEWKNNNADFRPETRKALTHLFQASLSASENHELALRHAFIEPQAKSKGLSMTNLHTVDNIFAAINTQYQDRRQRGWAKKNDVEVNLNLQEFTNPKSPFKFDYPETDSEAPFFTNGTPPIGGYTTTDLKNHTVTIKMVIGDNRAAQQSDEICDIVTFEIGEEDQNSHTPTLKIRNRIPGKRKYVILDRHNKIINKAKLLPEMRSGYINISDLELFRIAAFSYAASHLNKVPEDTRVEFSLGDRGFYFNELEPWQPREIQNPDIFAPKYKLLFVAKNFNDLDQLLSLPVEHSLPGAILIDKQIQNLSATEIGTAVAKLESIIETRRKLASFKKEQNVWDQLIYFALGNDGEHRTVNALSVARHPYLPLATLPPLAVGDSITPVYRPEINSFWLKNNSIAGDGVNIINASACCDIAPRNKIGPKAHTIETARENNVITPPPIFLTSDAFFNILKTNRVYSTWKYLPYANSPEELAKSFEKIHTALKTISPEIWEQLVFVIQRQFPDWEKMFLVARSSNILEDALAGSSNNYAGSFASFLKLNLKPEHNQAVDYASDKPTGLATAILEVIKSSFTPELAHSLWTNNEEQREALLRSWQMPVLIMPYVDGLASGVIFRNNPTSKSYAQSRSEIMIVLNRGLEGAVRASDERPRLTFIVNRDKLQSPSIKATVQFPNQNPRPLALDELNQYLDPRVTPSHLLELAKTSIYLSDDLFHAPQDTEFVIDTDGNSVIVQTREQPRPKISN